MALSSIEPTAPKPAVGKIPQKRLSPSIGHIYIQRVPFGLRSARVPRGLDYVILSP